MHLYIHIPFCKKKCGYCDFYSLPSQTNHFNYDEFIKALCEEIKLRESKKSILNTVYFGGGTPSLLSTIQMEKIFFELDKSYNFENIKKVTIEVNPESITLEKLKFYKKIGINRISIGIQSFQDKLLQILGRAHTSKQAIQAVKNARKAGFENINLDLIFGIPGQTIKDWQNSLKSVIDLSPEHISVYNLTYEKNTPFYSLVERGVLEAIDEEVEENLYNLSVKLLSEARYCRYEISNYCKSGFESKHNLAYWNYQTYLGFGPSAHSYDGKIRSWNFSDLKKYIDFLNKGNLPIECQEKISPQNQLDEWVFLQMRQTKGLNLSSLQKLKDLSQINWSEELNKHFGDKWQELIKYKKNTISFSKKGFWLSDEILPILLNLFHTN